MFILLGSNQSENDRDQNRLLQSYKTTANLINKTEKNFNDVKRLTLTKYPEMESKMKKEEKCEKKSI